MSKRDNQTFIRDMLARIELIEEFTVEGKEAFLESRMMQEAVIRGLEVIGEASRNISDELREEYSQVPWRQIIAFRNFAIHVYWEIKLERIWEIIENDLPELKSQLEHILAQFPENDAS